MSQLRSRPPFLLLLYQHYLERQDAAEFVRCVAELYTVGTLERLAGSKQREIRRAAILALGFLGDYDSNHVLGIALTDEDRAVRVLAENGIRNLWTRVGSETDRQELNAIIRLNAAQLHKEAVNRATRLIERAPWFAEAWYQRAVALAALGRTSDAIRDCHQTLEINPYHFLAATSMGQAHLQLGNTISALECFRRALRLNPNLEGVRAIVERLTRTVEGGK